MLNRLRNWIKKNALWIVLAVALIIFASAMIIGIYSSFKRSDNTNEERTIHTEKRVESETSIDSILSVVESKSSEIKTLKEQINQSKKRQNEADRSYKGKDRTFIIHADSTIAELERIRSDVNR